MATGRVAALEAELELAKVEERFVAAKADGTVTKKLRATLAETRHRYRTVHRAPVAGSVQPSTVKGKVN